MMLRLILGQLVYVTSPSAEMTISVKSLFSFCSIDSLLTELLSTMHIPLYLSLTAAPLLTFLTLVVGVTAWSVPMHPVNQRPLSSAT
jgi:hypothetical protein